MDHNCMFTSRNVPRSLSSMYSEKTNGWNLPIKAHEQGFGDDCELKSVRSWQICVETPPTMLISDEVRLFVYSVLLFFRVLSYSPQEIPVMSRLNFSPYSLYIICRKITTFQATSEALALATWSDKPWNQKTCHGYSQSWEKHKYIGAASANWFSIVHGLKLFQTSSFPGVFPQKRPFFPAVDGQKTTPQQFGSYFFWGFFKTKWQNIEPPNLPVPDSMTSGWKLVFGSPTELLRRDVNMCKKSRCVRKLHRYHLVGVSTQLKNIRQNGNLSQIGVTIKNIWNHHLVMNISKKQYSHLGC